MPFAFISCAAYVPFLVTATSLLVMSKLLVGTSVVLCGIGGLCGGWMAWVRLT